MQGKAEKGGVVPAIAASDDAEDAAIEASWRAGEWESVGDIDQRREFWRKAAADHVRGKRQRISLSIPERDLQRLRAKAITEGIPYQTLINSLIHKYVEGTL
jgi:predicted DNA binding CopG/RHH family protein